MNINAIIYNNAVAHTLFKKSYQQVCLWLLNKSLIFCLTRKKQSFEEQEQITPKIRLSSVLSKNNIVYIEPKKHA